MIGYYVHHHGKGHLTRARCIAAALPEPVTVLSSFPAPDQLDPFVAWVQLTPDDHDRDRIDVAAGGALHWAPRRAPGYQARMHQLAAWVERESPRVVVVDVSVEVTAFLRLLGVTVVVMAGPGRREDPVHQLGYQLATRIIAPWPQAIYAPDHLLPHASKVEYVGAISRFDGRAPEAAPAERSVVVLFGNGGDEVSRGDIAAAKGACPEWSWRAFGGAQQPWSDDIWRVLQSADVIVSHAGQNAIAEIAAVRRPAILVPQQRPFSEQEETAAALAAANIAVSQARWPSVQKWPQLLDECARDSGDSWVKWNRGDGAQKAAAAIASADD